MAHHKHHHHHRRRNPFAPGGINTLAVKVAGGLVGGIAATMIPNMVGSLGTGWGGVVAALAIAFGGSYITRGISGNFSEGVLIGGTLQAAGRVSQLLLKKTVVQFSPLGAYGPMSFPVPTPAYSLSAGMTPPSVPASASKATKMVAAPATMGKYNPRYSKWA